MQLQMTECFAEFQVQSVHGAIHFALQFAIFLPLKKKHAPPQQRAYEY